MFQQVCDSRTAFTGRSGHRSWEKQSCRHWKVSPFRPATQQDPQSFTLTKSTQTQSSASQRNAFRNQNGIWTANDAVEQSNRELKEAEQSPRSEPGPAGSADLRLAFALGGRPCRESQATRRPGVGECGEAADDVITELVERLCQLENAYFSERQQDIRDVGRRILRHLTGALPWSTSPCRLTR